MSQVKLESTESIEEINTSLQILIEQADLLLSNMEHRSSYSNSSSSSSSSMFDDNRTNPSTSQDNMFANNAEPETEQDTSTVSALPNLDVDCDSSSDTIILCNHDETNAEHSVDNNGRPIAEANNSFEQEVIVIGTPIIEPQNRHRARRDANRQNVDTSVIDLSNYSEFHPPLPTEPIVISSDEENHEPAAAAVTTRQPPDPRNWSSITITNYGVSVQTAARSSISVSLSNRRRNRRNIEHLSDFGENGRMGPVVPAAIGSPPPSSQPTIICPICYETLANQQAVSTSCGHVFCSNCIRLSLQTARKCPICNRKLTRASQMHPVYFSTG